MTDLFKGIQEGEDAGGATDASVSARTAHRHTAHAHPQGEGHHQKQQDPSPAAAHGTEGTGVPGGPQQRSRE